MTTYRPRWRADAHGYVSAFAGQWATAYTFARRDVLERIVRDLPNGDQIEIMEVEE
jgi:hypothetical protein